jgi:hypothetical protein
VTSYGPFRELHETIQEVNSIDDDWQDPVCFYLIALEGATILTPVWVEYDQLELIGFPAETMKPPNELTSDKSLGLSHSRKHERGLALNFQMEESPYGRSSPSCASISSRTSGVKSDVISVIVLPVPRNPRCLYGRAIFLPVAGMMGSVGRIKSPVCVPVTAVTKSTLQL